MESEAKVDIDVEETASEIKQNFALSSVQEPFQNFTNEEQNIILYMGPPPIVRQNARNDFNIF